MIHRLINLLNDQSTPFKILNLYEDKDTDYLLVSIESMLVAVEVSYGDEISFKRISQESKGRVLCNLSTELIPIPENNYGATIFV